MKRALIFTAYSGQTHAMKEQLIGPGHFLRAAVGNRFDIYKLRSAKNLESEVKDIEVAVYETGGGQEAASLPVQSIFEAFDADLVLLLGCAKGEANMTAVGDVFIATQVWNYEAANVSRSAKIKLTGTPIKPDRLLIDEARSIRDFGNWINRTPRGQNKEVKVHFDHIASGQKAIEHANSQTWQIIKRNIPHNIYACETEGHGFLSSISSLKTFALMIQGISSTFDEPSDCTSSSGPNAASNAAAFAAQLVEEIDVAALRRQVVSKEGAGAVSHLLGELTIKIEANKKDHVDIIQKIFAVSIAEKFRVLNIEPGSVKITVQLDIKSAAFVVALFRGNYLDYLIGYKILNCTTNISGTDDIDFDQWMAEISNGNIQGRNIPDIYKDQNFLKHVNSLLPRLSAEDSFQNGTLGYHPLDEADDSLPKKQSIQVLKEVKRRENERYIYNQEIYTIKATDRFFPLRLYHKLTLNKIARTANVSKDSMRRLSRGDYITRTVAERVFDALKELTGEKNMRFEYIFRSRK